MLSTGLRNTGEFVARSVSTALRDGPALSTCPGAAPGAVSPRTTSTVYVSSTLSDVF